MKAFSGFPAGKVRTVSIPGPVFTELMPIIDDLAELKLTLHVLWRLSQQRGELRFLRYADLASVGGEALTAFVTDVRSGAFPGPDETYHLSDAEAEALGLYG